VRLFSRGSCYCGKRFSVNPGHRQHWPYGASFIAAAESIVCRSVCRLNKPLPNKALPAVIHWEAGTTSWFMGQRAIVLRCCWSCHRSSKNLTHAEFLLVGLAMGIVTPARCSPAGAMAYEAKQLPSGNSSELVKPITCAGWGCLLAPSWSKFWLDYAAVYSVVYSCSSTAAI